MRKSKAKAKPPKKTPQLRSGFEKKTKTFLESQKIPFEYETERIPYTVPETKKNYIPDFIVVTRSGKKLYLECKGRWLSSDFIKLKLVKQQNPDLDIRMIFQRNNKIRPGSKTTYTMRAAKLGIPCVVSLMGHPPLSWLEE